MKKKPTVPLKLWFYSLNAPARSTKQPPSSSLGCLLQTQCRVEGIPESTLLFLELHLRGPGDLCLRVKPNVCGQSAEPPAHTCTCTPLRPQLLQLQESGTFEAHACKGPSM